MKKFLLTTLFGLSVLITGIIVVNHRPSLIQSAASAQTTECDANDTVNWCQVGRDPQHTSYTPQLLGTNIRVSWTHPFQPDKVYPQNQAIIYHGKVYVGTEGANGQTAAIYALNAATGAQVWKHDIGSPILSSVAASNNQIIVSAMDGAVYSLDSESGTQIWKNQLSPRLGFSTSPIVAAGKIFLGGRDGKFYALDNQGNKLWEYIIGYPIYQTAAYNNGKVFVGAMDLRTYALDATTGSLIWKSFPMFGLALKDFYPVVYQGIVFNRPVGMFRSYNGRAHSISPPYPFSAWFSSDADYAWLTTNGPAIAAGNLTQVTDAMNAQTTVINDYLAHPQNYVKNLYTYSENNGQEVLTGPDWVAQSHSGTVGPPCIDRDGKPIVPLFLARSGWGRLDIASQRITDILFDNRNAYDGGPIVNTGGYNASVPAGMGNPDENLQVTCVGNMVIALHWMEGNANYTGFFNQDTRRWTPLGWGFNGQMSSNTQGGIGNPASVANSVIYHISLHELIARSTN